MDQAVIHGFPLPAQRNSKREKLSKALFSAYAVVGIRSSKITLGDGVPTDRTAFTEKLICEDKKIRRFISKSPV